MLPCRGIFRIKISLYTLTARNKLQHNRRREFVVCLASALHSFKDMNRVPAPRWFRGRRWRKRWKKRVPKEVYGYGVSRIPSK